MGTTSSPQPRRLPAPPRGKTPRPKPGFTLVELLVVMTILGILAGLISGAVIMARTRAKIAQIRLEISQLEQALESYKSEVGEYPPDFTDQTAVVNHIRKRFPKYRLLGNNTIWNQFVADMNNAYGVDPTNFGPTAALVFWLGGLPDGIAGTGKPAGFHADVQNPFRQGTPRTTPFFEFKTEQLQTVFNGPAYIPVGLNTAPYVYFKARRVPATQRYDYPFLVDTRSAFVQFSPGDVCVPYFDGNVAFNMAQPWAAATIRPWRSLEKYQIISAGLDEKFGSAAAALPRLTRSGDNLSPEDMDNITSFAETRLEAELP